MSAHLRSSRVPPDSSWESGQDTPLGWHEISGGGSGRGEGGVDSGVGRTPPPHPFRTSDELSDGPFTLVVPFETPGEASFVQPERENEDFADSARGGADGEHKQEEIIVDSSEVVWRASRTIGAAAAAAAPRGGAAVEAVPRHISFHAPAYEETVAWLANNPNAVAAKGDDSDSGEDATTGIRARLIPALHSRKNGHRRRGHTLDAHRESKIDSNVQQPLLAREDVKQRPEQQETPRWPKNSEQQQGEQQRQPPQHAVGIPTWTRNAWGNIRR